MVISLEDSRSWVKYFNGLFKVATFPKSVGFKLSIFGVGDGGR